LSDAAELGRSSRERHHRPRDFLDAGRARTASARFGDLLRAGCCTQQTGARGRRLNTPPRGASKTGLFTSIAVRVFLTVACGPTEMPVRAGAFETVSWDHFPCWGGPAAVYENSARMVGPCKTVLFTCFKRPSAAFLVGALPTPGSAPASSGVCGRRRAWGAPARAPRAALTAETASRARPPSDLIFISPKPGSDPIPLLQLGGRPSASDQMPRSVAPPYSSADDRGELAHALGQSRPGKRWIAGFPLRNAGARSHRAEASFRIERCRPRLLQQPAAPAKRFFETVQPAGPIANPTSSANGFPARSACQRLGGPAVKIQAHWGMVAKAYLWTPHRDRPDVVRRPLFFDRRAAPALPAVST